MDETYTWQVLHVDLGVLLQGGCLLARDLQTTSDLVLEDLQESLDSSPGSVHVVLCNVNLAQRSSTLEFQLDLGEVLLEVL